MCGNLFTSISFFFFLFLERKRTNEWKIKEDKMFSFNCSRFEFQCDRIDCTHLQNAFVIVLAPRATVQWHRQSLPLFRLPRRASERQTMRLEQQQQNQTKNNKIETILFTARRNHDKCTCECLGSLCYCLESCRFAANLLTHTHTHQSIAPHWRTVRINSSNGKHFCVIRFFFSHV